MIKQNGKPLPTKTIILDETDEGQLITLHYYTGRPFKGVVISETVADFGKATPTLPDVEVEPEPEPIKRDKVLRKGDDWEAYDEEGTIGYFPNWKEAFAAGKWVRKLTPDHTRNP